MRIKTLIFLLCLWCFFPRFVLADVDSVSLRMNLQGQITGVSTTGSDADIVTSAIMPESEEVLSAEEILPSENEDALWNQEVIDDTPDSDLNDTDVLLTDDVASIVPENESQNTDAVEITETPETNKTLDESVPVMRGMLENEEEENACEAAGGTGDVDNCICQNGGVFMLGNDNIYRCCKNNAPYIVAEGAYSSVPLVPQCGCNVEYNGRRFREPYIDGAEKVCCVGKNRVWSSDMGTSGYVYEEDAANCGCPEAAEGDMSIKEVTTQNGEFYCCQGSKYLQNKNAWQTSFLYCGCSDNRAGCTTQELCEAAAQDYDKPWAWCASSQRCLLASAMGGCDCVEGQQRLSGGACMICPQEGMLYVVNGLEAPLCCKQRIAANAEMEPAGYLYNETEGKWAYNPICGCPQAWNALGDEQVIGELISNTCCHNGYAFDENAQAYTQSAFNICGCPDHGTWMEETGSCCQDGKPWDGQMKTYQEDRDAALCGCAADETSVMKQGSLYCCKNGHVVGASSEEIEVLETVTEAEICGCETGVWDSTTGQCVPCLTDANCGEGLHCALSRDNPEDNACVQCLNSGHCSSPMVCNNSHTCGACAHGVYYEGECVECLQDSDCTDSTKPVCDTTTRTCQKCLLHTSPVDPDKGCVASYCVEETSKIRVCSQCADDSNCVSPQCESGLCSNCSGSNCACEENSDCVPKCIFQAGQEKGTCSNCANGNCGVCSSDEECARPKCNLTAKMCTKLCPDGRAAKPDGSCEIETKCDPNSATPVWWPQGNRCVYCYDSISEDWTDLGCPGVNDRDIATYDTHAYITEKKKRICLINRNHPKGTCVECLKDSHCREGLTCNNNQCSCLDNGYYSSSLKLCVECTANYGTATDANQDIFPCTQAKPYCNKSDYTCYECNANYGVTGSGKAACPAARPICDQTTHICQACPSSTPHYKTSTNSCVACGAHSTYNSSLGKCVCDLGYGVVIGGNQCVSTGAASVATSALNKCTTQDACQSLDIFEFTTVANMRYTLQFSGKITYGDWAKFTCAGAILGKENNAGTGKTQKSWCSNVAFQIVTNPDDTRYCSDATTGSCKDHGSGDGGNCARSTVTTSANNVNFVGDGRSCKFTVVNGNGGCTTACTVVERVGTQNPSIAVVPRDTSYTP